MTTMHSPGGGRVPNVPGQQPLNLFRYGEQTVWSTYAFPSGAVLANGDFSLFSVQLGSTGQGFNRGLQISETNIRVGGQLPQGQALEIFSVATQVFAGTTTAGGEFGLANIPIVDFSMVQDLASIVNNGILSWNFTQTTIDICPVMLSGAGGGLYGSVSVNAAGTSTGAMNNGATNVFRYHRQPVQLPGQTVFSVRLRFGPAAAPIAGTYADQSNGSMAVRVVLAGFYKNVIELG
jgi:hypothetical protein